MVYLLQQDILLVMSGLNILGDIPVFLNRIMNQCDQDSS